MCCYSRTAVDGVHRFTRRRVLFFFLSFFFWDRFVQFSGLAFPRTPSINISWRRILQLSIIKCYIFINILKIKCDFSAVRLQGWKFNVCLEGSCETVRRRFLPQRKVQLLLLLLFLCRGFWVNRWSAQAKAEELSALRFIWGNSWRVL